MCFPASPRRELRPSLEHERTGNLKGGPSLALCPFLRGLLRPQWLAGTSVPRRVSSQPDWGSAFFRGQRLCTSTLCSACQGHEDGHVAEGRREWSGAVSPGCPPASLPSPCLTYPLNKCRSPRRFQIGRRMKTNTAVLRLLPEDPGGPLTAAEASACKP